MSQRRSKNAVQTRRKVNLPRVPVGNAPATSQEEFWKQKGHAGSINAFRQLTHSVHKGGRKTVALPGGRLQPLFKNHTAPSKQELDKVFGPRALPCISPSPDGANQQTRVVRGACTNLPDESPTTVKIYMASNYEDMKEERNVIFKYAVPKLQEFCSERSLLFQLVDMSWGMEQNTRADLGMDTEPQEQEIADCQAVSLGPHFIALLGDKYGTLHYVKEIPEDEFEVLHFTASEEVLDNSELLSKYYFRNHNASPPRFTLQMSEDDKEMESLGILLRQAAKLAYEAGKLSRRRHYEFCLSSVARDVTQGIFYTKDPRSHCLAYLREFRNLGEHVSEPDAETYVDVTSDVEGHVTVDAELQELKARLCDEVKQHLGVGNCKQYFLSWEEAAQGKHNQEYSNYLHKLCHDFVSDVKDLINQGTDKLGHLGGRKPDAVIYQHVLYHARTCERYADVYQGQGDLLWKIEQFMRDPRRNNKPFIIHGARGSGKSATVARVTGLVREWFTPDCVTVVRFLGTSSECSTLYRAVMSVTVQICAAYSLPLPDYSADFSTLYKTLLCFRATIDKVSREHAFVHPLFILLDGLDQLQNHQESLRSMWAIRDLPVNVFVVLSTTSQVGNTNLLGALTALVSAEDSIGETQAPGPEEAATIIARCGERANLKLTDDQGKKLVETFSSNAQLLYLRHLTSYALGTWESYTVGDKLQLFDSAPARFLQTLDTLEDDIGPNIVMFLVAYVTVAPIGVHVRELQDLLSNNQDVMTEVHKFNLSPPDDVLMFPPALLAQAQCGFKDYLTYHRFSGKKVLAWNHSEFYIAAAEKYNLIYPGIAEERVTEEFTSFTLMLQEHVANLYLRDVTEQEQLFSQSARHSAKHNHQQLVQMPQPVSAENQFKLQRLPTHIKVLIPVEGLQRSKQQLLFNLEWLRTKLVAGPLFSLLQEVDEVSSLARALYEQGILEEDHHQLEVLYEFLQLAVPALAESPEHLPGEILGRLAGLGQEAGQENISALVQQAREAAGRRMLPVFPCLTPPLQPLRHTLPGPTHVVGFLHEGEVVVMFSQKTGVDIWHIETGELLQRFAVNPEQRVAGVITGKTSEFVIIGHYSHLDHEQQVSVWSSETGVRLVHSTHAQNFEHLALNQSDDTLVVVTSMHVPGSFKLQRCLLAVDVHTKDVKHVLEVADVHDDGITDVFFAANSDGTESVVTLGDRKGRDVGIWSLEPPGLKHRIEVGCVVDFHQFSLALGKLILANRREGLIQIIDVDAGVVTDTLRKPAYAGMVDLYVPETVEFLVVATPRRGIILHSAQMPGDDTVIALPSQFDDSPPIPAKVTMDEAERYLVVGYESGLVRVYSVCTGDLIQQLQAHTARVNSLRVRRETLFSAADDGVAKVWRYLSQVTPEVISEATNPEINPFLAIKGNDEKLPVVGGEGQKFPHHQENITCVLVHPDGKRVLTSSHTGPIKVWDITTGELVGKVEEDTEHGVAEMYTAYRNKLLIGHCHLPNNHKARSLKVWKMDTLSPVPWDRNTIQIFCSCLFPSDDKILTFSPSPNKQPGMVIGIYDLFEMKAVNMLHCNIFGSMDCSNLRLIGFTRARETPGPPDPPGTPESRPEGEEKLYAVLDYFPQDAMSFFFTFVIKGANHEEISMETHEPIHIDTVSPWCAHVLPHGRCLAGTTEGTLLVWDVTSHTVLGNLYDRVMLEAVREGKRALDNPNVTGRPAHDGAVTYVAKGTGPDGEPIAVTGGVTGNIKVWNLDTHKMTMTIKAHKTVVLYIKLASGNKMVSGAVDSTIVVSDMTSGDVLTTFYAHKPVMGLDVSRDLTRVAACVGERNSQMILLDVNLEK